MIDWNLFEKCKIEKAARGIREVSIVTLSNGNPCQIYITSSLAVKLGWKPGDRADLYRLGSTFILKKSDVGVITFRKHGREGRNGCRLVINSTSAYMNIAPFTKDKQLDAWIEEGCLVFKGEPTHGSM